MVNDGGDLYKGGIQPIGHVESVFVERNGTPRQGAPSSVSTQPPDCRSQVSSFRPVAVSYG